ncbi:MAG TPA: pyruvate carboxylase, partial [Micrococcaceae bacterium]|nr:pyruvate carboxylase [Micrococcaceae bacterium]
NLRQQAIALGLGERFEAIESMYASVNDMLGNVVEVTPSSKVVGDLALQLVGSGVPAADFESNPQNFDIPDSVIQFLSGELGNPPGGWPEPFRTKALQGRTVRDHVEAVSDEDLAALTSDDETIRATLNRLLFAGPTRDFEKSVENYGDLSVLHTRDYLFGLTPDVERVVSLGTGVRLLVKLISVSEADEKGLRTVVFSLNGQSRQIKVRDESVESTVKSAPKADPKNSGHVAAPFAGAVTINVKVGDLVESGQSVATIEAMKMEAGITTNASGVVSQVTFEGTSQVQGGDLLLVIEPK